MHRFINNYMMSFQKKATQWVVETFGIESMNKHERALRFLEEAIELAQASNINRQEVLNMVEYVCDRPIGNLRQEIGGVMVTLVTLAEACGVDVETCGVAELERIHKPEIIAKCKAKNTTKPR